MAWMTKWPFPLSAPGEEQSRDTHVGRSWRLLAWGGVQMFEERRDLYVGRYMIHSDFVVQGPAGEVPPSPPATPPVRRAFPAPAGPRQGSEGAAFDPKLPVGGVGGALRERGGAGNKGNFERIRHTHGREL